ncbi:MAG: hypothetical protein HQL67_05620 [Magnetococcales bacterium]|nr:hypothetical protein [Magnetococcales bacterium]
MSNPAQIRNLALLYRLFTAIGLLLLIAAYFSPIWWVSLEAPQYPKATFPDGIRIHFHFTGVHNGCTEQESAEIEIGEGIDCVEEMDTINHYVGMAPTSAGGPIERGLSHFSFSILGLMLLVFLMPDSRKQIGVLAGGYSAILVWMLVSLYGQGHVEVIAADFAEGMGQFFNDKNQIIIETENLKTNIGLIVAAYGVIMLGITLALWKAGNGLRWVLALVPASLSVIFVLDYAGWLYWFGHSLHPWGAFSVKPFMPTVFGDGKVAQFTTHSYPHYGYFLLLAMTLVLLVAILLRRKMTRLAVEQTDGAGAFEG